MNFLSLLLIPFSFGLVSTSSCIPSEFKTECLNISQTTGYLSTYYNGYCWVQNEFDGKDWNTASSKCNQDYENGRLAFVTSREELEAIRAVIDLGLGVWSGLARNVAQAQPTGWQYVNSDGAMAYAKDPINEWSPGSPMPGGDDFTMITNDGYIQQNPAMDEKYLCQFPEPPSCPNIACFDRVSKDNKAAASMGNVTIDVFTDVNFHRCSRLCADLATCQSFAHNENTKQCELYWLPIEALTLEPAAGFNMADRNPHFENCETPQDCFDVCNRPVSSGGSPSYSDQSFPDGSFLDQTQLTLTCDSDKRYIQGTTATHVAVSTCDAPNWTPNDMTCQPVCNPMAPIPNGGSSSYSNQSYSDGSYPDQTELTLACDADKRYMQGTTASRIAVSTCNAPNWSSNDMTCQTVCQPFTLTVGLSATYSQSFSDDTVAIGETVTLECNGIHNLYVNGEKHSGPNVVVSCTAPDWDITDIECGGHILVFGGKDNTAKSTVESFYPEDPSSNQIEAALNPTRFGSSVGLIGDKVMVAGGKASSHLKSSTIYDPVTTTFAVAQDMSVSHHNGAGAVIHDIFYICGGLDPTKATCEKFTGGTWMPIAPMSTPRRRLSVVALNGKVYAIGGFDGSSVLSSVEAYDPDTESWNVVAPLPGAIDHHAAATLNGHIYICGVYGTSISTCYKYSDVTDTWIEVASMNKVRNHPKIVEIGGKLVALGGEDDSGQTSVEIYDPDADTWRMHADTLIHARYRSAAVVVK